MSVEVRRAGSEEDLEGALAVRREVFVDEQGVSVEEEIDGRDAEAAHVVAVDEGGRVVGTCRVLPAGEGAMRIGRMAVVRGLRGSGAGAALLAEAERVVTDLGAAEAVLDAQLTAQGFYERAGYHAEGGVFLDAGIEHVRMRRRLADRPAP